MLIIKKFLIIIICIFVFTFNNNVEASTPDTTPPVLTNFSINGDTFAAGDTLYLNLVANDDISGLKSGLIEFYSTTDFTNTLFANIVNINSNPSIIIPPDITSGNYTLRTIELFDSADNYVTYLDSSHPCDSNNCVSYNFNKTITITNGKTDTKAPIVSSVTIDKKELSPSETLTIKVKIDDASEIKVATAALENLNTHVVDHVILSYDASGYYIGKYVAKNNTASYKIFNLYVTDNVNNVSSYYSESEVGVCFPSNNQYCTLPDDLTFNVTSSVNDTEAPILSNVYFSKDKVSSPATLKVYVEAYDNGSGLPSTATISLGVKQADGTLKYYPSLINGYSPSLTLDSNTNKYVGNVSVDQYIGTGEIGVMWIDLKDNAGNEVHYQYNSPEGLNVKKLAINPILQVVETVSYEVVAGTSTNDIVDKINDTSESAVIMIDSTKNNIVSKAIFDSIRGTNKTIYIESNGIQWIFSGKDIINTTKDINVGVNISTINDYSSNDNLNEMINSGIVISFAPNGLLPGKVLIRIKAEYTFRDYIGTSNLMVYYYDETDDNLDTVAKKIEMTEDGYYEFYINHNSKYVISNKEINKKYISSNKSDLALNIENSNASKDDTEIVEALDIVSKTNNNAVDQKNKPNYILYIIISCSIILSVLLVIILIKRKAIFNIIKKIKSRFKK